MTNEYEPPRPPEPPRPEAKTDAIYRPATGATSMRQRANEETTLLTPVTDHTHALDRLPISTRKRLYLLAAASGGVAVLLLGLTIYLWVTTVRWQDRAADLEAAAYVIGDNLAEEQALVVAQQAELDLLREQLKTAQDRVLELANEKANEADSAAAAEQRIALLQTRADLGGAVALALNRCVNEQEALAKVIADSGSYDQQELKAYQDSVQKLCKSAKAANAALQKELLD